MKTLHGELIAKGREGNSWWVWSKCKSQAQIRATLGIKGTGLLALWTQVVIFEIAQGMCRESQSWGGRTLGPRWIWGFIYYINALLCKIPSGSDGGVKGRVVTSWVCTDLMLWDAQPRGWWLVTVGKRDHWQKDPGPRTHRRAPEAGGGEQWVLDASHLTNQERFGLWAVSSCWFF